MYTSCEESWLISFGLFFPHNLLTQKPVLSEECLDSKIVKEFMRGNTDPANIAQKYGVEEYVVKQLLAALDENLEKEFIDDVADIRGSKKEAIIKMYKAGVSVKNICKSVICSSVYCFSVLKDNGISVRKERVMVKEVNELKIVDLYKQGAQVSEISKRLGVPPQRVSRILNRHGAKSTAREDKAPMESKIIEMHLSGKSKVDIQKETGASKSYIGVVIRTKCNTKIIPKRVVRNNTTKRGLW